MAFPSINSDSLYSCFTVSKTVIDVGHVCHELRYSCGCLFGDIEVGRGQDRFSDRFFLHDLFSSAGHHGGEVLRYDLVRLSLQMDLPMIHPDRPVGQASDRFHVVRDENDRHTLPLELLNPPDATLLEEDVADRESLIHDQDVRVHMNGDGKCQADKHAAGVRFHRPVHEVTDLRKLFDRGYSFTGLCVGEAENRSVEENVFATGEQGIESGAQLQERGNPPPHGEVAGRRPNHACNHSQERALARPIFADDTETAAALYLNINIPHRPERFVESASPQEEKLFQVIRRMPVDPETLCDLLGRNDGHSSHVNSVARIPYPARAAVCGQAALREWPRICESAPERAGSTAC